MIRYRLRTPEDIVKEHEYLVSVRRAEVSEHLKEAKSYGDLSENAEYDAAKDEQAELEARINRLEYMMRNARVVSEDELTGDHVNLGLSVKIKDLDTKEKLEAIPGTPPNMIYPPKGDAFAARNKYAMAIDFELEPPMFEISETHKAATWLLHEMAPKVDPPKAIIDRIERMKKKSAIGGNE